MINKAADELAKLREIAELAHGREYQAANKAWQYLIMCVISIMTIMIMTTILKVNSIHI